MPFTAEEENALKVKWLAELQESANAKIPPPSQMPEPPPKKSLTIYIVSIMIMGAVVVAGITALSIFSPEGRDNTATITLVIGLGSLIVTGIFQIIKSDEASAQSRAAYLMVNSRFQETVDKEVAIARAEGAHAERNRADAVEAAKALPAS